MKAIFASFVCLLFSIGAQAQLQMNSSISDVAIAADNSLSFKITDAKSGAVTLEKSQELRDGKSAVWNSADSSVTLFITHYGKFLTFAASNLSAKTGQGQFFIFEEMNSLYVGLTLAPIIGNNASIAADSKRMIEISKSANGGDIANGMHKVVEEFRKNPRLTIQSYLSRMATRPVNAPIPVGERNKIQTVRSFDELLGGGTNAPSVAARAPVKRKVRRKPRPVVRQEAPPPQLAPQPRGFFQPLNLNPFLR